MKNDSPQLGRLAGRSAGRDAIHVAIAPVVAAERLEPAARVGLDELGRAVGCADGAIGIVDPFLTVPVEVGERFWLCLMPGSITALRHVWSHKAFVIRLPASPLARGARADADSTR